MTEFVYGVNIRATTEGTATLRVTAGAMTFEMPNPEQPPLTIAEAQTLGAVLELVTVEQLARSPLPGARATAFGFMHTVTEQFRFAETVRAMAAEAEAEGVAVNHEALVALVGWTR